MVFTIEEIKNYLQTKGNIEDAISHLSEQSITSCNDYPSSFNYEKSDQNLLKYEMQIGLAKLKEEQRTIYRNSNGRKGKYWLACSPKWISEESKISMNTEYEIGYWVNYGDDETYGWFSVEQIREWLTTPSKKLYEFGGTRERVCNAE